jgi:hypothetical protein
MYEEIEKKVEEQASAIVEKKENPAPTKSIGEVSINDVEFTLDKNKNYEQQMEDVIGAVATREAVKDEKTSKDLIDKKSEELKAKANKKLKVAQKEDISAETDKQEAERKRYEAVLSTFGMTKHLPNWLLKIMVFLFSPIFIALTIIIGIPCGIVKILIDNIDNILVRYENAETTYKPKIKVTVWIILVFLVISAIALVVLAALGKI